MIEVRRYITAGDKDVIGEWLAGLKDKKAWAKIRTRIARLRAGNYGDAKWIAEKIHELRIDHGPGYRVYFTKLDRETVLLLCGGDKRTQTANIARAIALRCDYEKRMSRRGQASRMRKR